MSGLVEALVDDLGAADIRTDSPVAALERRDDGYVVRTNDEDIEADAVIAAVPAFAASQLLRTLDEGLADELNNIVYSEAVVVTLVYPASAGAAPSEGSGLLVPSNEGKLLTACAWFSEKWEHARPADGSLVLRCFVAKPGVGARADVDLVEAIGTELRPALGLRGSPTETKVTRWQAALPVYRVGHLDLVRRIEERVGRLPGLAVGGAGYRGSGLPDCIEQGHRAAHVVMGALGADL
jgi:oxygen-dependent protoporphyrinogen oxidase